MATTDFGQLTKQRKILWPAYTLAAGRDMSFFLGKNGFLGKDLADSSRPIHFVNELTKTAGGTKCVLSLVHDLEGDGVAGDTLLEGNEEAISSDYIEIQVDQWRNGCKSAGRMSEQRTVIKFRLQAKDKLAWWSADKEDEQLFLAASGVSFSKKTDGSTRGVSAFTQLAYAADVTAPTSNRVLYAGVATSTATLTAADVMSWKGVHDLRTAAVRRRLKPIRINGKEHYILTMSPEQYRDLCNDNDYKQAVANAANRGKDNPLFKGEAVTVGGVVIYEHNKIYNTTGLASGSKWGSGGLIDGAQALLMGAQALGYARIGGTTWEESDNTDYKNRAGIAYGKMIGMIKNVFTSIYDKDTNGNKTAQDFAIISYYTAARAIA